MPNGSLDKLLYSNKKLNIDWFHRFRILRGVASGLLYLHEEWEQVVLHRDIKPGNVLLDVDLNGKLGDFGLARLHDHGSNPQTTKLVGTIGYIAPELPTTGKASTSTDVYAFGVFMLEVASGKRPMEQRGFVIDCWRRGAILDASDPKLEGSVDGVAAKHQHQCPNKCGNISISYPFGIGKHCYKNKWFEITCQNQSSNLQQVPILHAYQLKILNLSNSEVRVAYTWKFSHCYPINPGVESGMEQVIRPIYREEGVPNTFDFFTK
ncbi:hypothetical protein LWI29_012441 [Acer saccharum]|uniref:non-specific serine/threonine protein kinase n=1 Tax=Acer saccharum TaxID=4024 RepID=A0AA39TF88_ACESA|nr:hypothetical protein LWI29_012441 [Acer saccharum]